MHIHPDVTEREKLLCSLFNMRKKPNKKERASIIGGIHKYIHSNHFIPLLFSYLLVIII